MFANCPNLKFLDISNFNITDEVLSYKYATDIFYSSSNIKYINLYNTIDKGLFSSISINRILNLTVCQKYNIITNPTARNICCGYDYNNSNCNFYHIIELQN